jgi:hypothetical protein
MDPNQIDVLRVTKEAAAFLARHQAVMDFPPRIDLGTSLPVMKTSRNISGRSWRGQLNGSRGRAVDGQLAAMHRPAADAN